LLFKSKKTQKIIAIQVSKTVPCTVHVGL